MTPLHNPIIGYCPKCQETVTGNPVDYGIGAYEYWGCKGVQTDIHIECPDCDSELEDVEEVYYD